jgi:aconitate hydratase
MTNPKLLALMVDAHTYQCVDLPALAGKHLQHLPVVLRVLLENVARCMQGPERTQAIAALLAWVDTGHSEAEIAFQPSRILMHDTTSTPALVDLAAMRDALREAGLDPTVLNPTLPIDVSVDHSLAVHVFAKPEASTDNLRLECQANAERYRFLRWAAQAFQGLTIHPPGTGIMHTINLEQLAQVVRTTTIDGQDWLVPDTLIGTDSHTPMVNSLGVLGWGVGGLEAQTVMLGMPTMLRIPQVLGVRFTGALPATSNATDLVLRLTQLIRQHPIDDGFVEFFGPGVSTLSASQRAVLANMAPEYGATTGYFAVDEQTLDYLAQTGRAPAHIARVRAYCQRQGLWFDPAAEPRYSRVLTLDLSQVHATVSGPTRPQDAMNLTDMRDALHRASPPPTQPHSDLPAYPVAVAAITSCTNTSDPGLLMAAGLLARKARALGLTPPAWVKTSLAPGSPAARQFLARAGLLDDLQALGFHIVGHGCTTCIGNTGALLSVITQAQQAHQINPVAVLSGNRNFPGRVHPELGLGFLMSPALVVAHALAGRADLDLSQDVLATSSQGQPVYLTDIWPSATEVQAALQQGLSAPDFPQAFAAASHNPLWEALTPPSGPCFAWDDASNALCRPPFAGIDQGSLLGHYSAYPLLVLGDDITTDHISPASAIPPHSPSADFLLGRGEPADGLNVFASRRGHWQVMVRGAFYAKSLRNLLAPGAPTGHTVHQPSGELMPIWDVAQRYAGEGQATVLVAGERYGMGSSRDWAAKNLRLLGVRAVLASSFERIHRTNLIGMGILPLTLPADVRPEQLALGLGDRIEVQAEPAHIGTGQPVQVHIVRASGQRQAIRTQAAVQTQLELALLRAGGVMPRILQTTQAATQAELATSA